MRIFFFFDTSRIDKKNIKICALNPEIQAKEYCGVNNVIESSGGHSVAFKG